MLGGVNVDEALADEEVGALLGEGGLEAEGVLGVAGSVDLLDYARELVFPFRVAPELELVDELPGFLEGRRKGALPLAS